MSPLSNDELVLIRLLLNRSRFAPSDLNTVYTNWHTHLGYEITPSDKVICYLCGEIVPDAYYTVNGLVVNLITHVREHIKKTNLMIFV